MKRLLSLKGALSETNKYNTKKSNNFSKLNASIGSVGSNEKLTFN